MKRLAAIATALTLLAGPALAVLPEEQLKDPALEARARELSKEIRCVVCQNQTIDDSDAPLAADLRVIVRERLVAGDTDQEVIDYLVARYGTFVLLKPPVEADTLILWLGPLAAVLLGGVGVAFYWRGRSKAATEPAIPLDDAEKTRLVALLKETPPS
ncbi:cytochrome c-type biogenesis protein CcmH [Rhizobium sp. CRIBSB]|nr:cytochrome c-type biogenesis protein CcmH [Rhizobium sp. CRIBSB]